MYISLYSSPHPRYIAWMYAEKCRTIFITFLFFSFFDLQWLKMKDLNKSFSQERNWTMWQNFKTLAQSVTLWIVWFLDVTCLILLTSECLDRNYVAFGVCILLFAFFFSSHVFQAFRDNYHCSRTVVALFMKPTATLFRKKILKMGLTSLFTHLKIILLQCFQFQ